MAIVEVLSFIYAAISFWPADRAMLLIRDVAAADGLAFTAEAHFRRLFRFYYYLKRALRLNYHQL